MSDAEERFDVFDLGLWEVKLTVSSVVCEHRCQCQTHLDLEYPWFHTRPGKFGLGLVIFNGCTATERPVVKLCDVHAAMAFEAAYAHDRR